MLFSSSNNDLLVKYKILGVLLKVFMIRDILLCESFLLLMLFHNS